MLNSSKLLHHHHHPRHALKCRVEELDCFSEVGMSESLSLQQCAMCSYCVCALTVVTACARS